MNSYTHPLTPDQAANLRALLTELRSLRQKSKDDEATDKHGFFTDD